jgi:hypothetical protein
MSTGAQEITAMDVDTDPKEATAATEATAPMETSSGDPSVSEPVPESPCTLNGCWVLDKTKGEWSMRGYLEAMNVNELAIKAHEKGEQEFDTIHTISLLKDRVKITKRSRVNADLVVDLPLGVEHTEYLPPGDRPKKSLAISNHPGHLQVESTMPTMNGVAKVTDIKELQTNSDAVDREANPTVVMQTLTIVNEQTGQTHTTTRYFIPYRDTPPHEVLG